MTTTAVIIIAAVIVAVIAAWFLFRQQFSKKLRSQFGPEYENAVHKYGSSVKAENALVARQRRIDGLHIHSLPPDERDRFANHWHELQSRSTEKCRNCCCVKPDRSSLIVVGTTPQSRDRRTFSGWTPTCHTDDKE